MRIDSVRIKNLRGIEDVTLQLHQQLTVLIGANNAGKTTVLDAIAAIVGFRRNSVPFSDVDFRSDSAGADVRNAAPIQVDLVIAPTEGASFRPGELGQVSFADVTETGERVHLRLVVSFDPDPSVQGLKAELQRVRGDGAVMDAPLRSFPFATELPFRAFGSERDLTRGTGGRWTDWGQVLADVRPDHETMLEAVASFEKGSDHLMRGTPALQDISNALSSAGAAVGLAGATVQLRAVPQDLEEMLRHLVIDMKLTGAQRAFRAERHGKGTHGALLFALYRLYVDKVLGAGNGDITPVLTVEEPETHLHPTAQRAMARQLEELPGQVIATSHSPELVRAMNGSTVLLRTTGGKTTARVTNGDLRDVREHPRALFARVIIVTEGLEADMVPWFAQAMGASLPDQGIEVVNAAGQDNIPRIWECFGPRGYGIPIVCLADADGEQKLLAFLKAAGLTDVTGSGPIQTALKEHHYFTCAWGTALEHELVDLVPDVVDATLLELQGDSFERWRERHAKHTLIGGKGTVGDLGDREARVYRLKTFKDFPNPFGRALTKGGQDASRVPPRFVDAINRAVELGVS